MGTAPRFSVVTTISDAGRDLDALLESIDAQTFPPGRVEVVVVDRGAVDAPREPLGTPATRRTQVRVLTLPVGGRAQARDLGLEHATGEWVTFPDPGDVLHPDYLREVDAFLRRWPKTPMVAARRLLRDDASDAVSDTHPLRRHFSAANRLRYLDEWTSHFPGSAAAAFFPTRRIAQLRLRFADLGCGDQEGGLFGCRYLLHLERPAIGFVTSAEHHRRRPSASPPLRSGRTDDNRPAVDQHAVDRYVTTPRDGYLALLQEATAGPQRAPEWLQTFVLHELFGYFSAYETRAGSGSAATGPVAIEFHRLLAEITRFLEPEVVADFAVCWTRPSWRFILQHAYSGEVWRQPYGWLDRTDHAQRLVRLRYHYTGPAPAESFTSGGREVEPAASKIRPLRFHGRDVMWERIVWLPSHRPLRARLDGRRLDLTAAVPEGHSYSAELVQLRDALPAPTPTPSVLRPLDRLTVWLSRSRPVRRLFGDAWVLMDRIHDGNDSGERLFAYLRKRRRKINAWFVLERGTPDFRRLRRRGHRRVVAHGSLPWKLLMLNAQHLISSHADVPIVQPPEILALKRPTWRFTFLQHGVIQSDLSGWLNPKAIDLFVVSTPQERTAISGDGSAYVFTTKEVTMSGLPRFDRLRRIGRAFPDECRDLILVTPTWRHWLLSPLAKGSQRRTVHEDFADSEFAREWLALLRSPDLAAVAAEQGLAIGFLPHPNLQQAMYGMDLPPVVQWLSYSGHDVQRFFGRAALLLTDYSSTAFDAAYIDRPVVYFQFDADRLALGDHVGRPDYFDYHRDAFGPITETADDAVRVITEILRAGRRPAAPYAQRIAEAFPDRDGGCSRRITDAILASTRRHLTPMSSNPTSGRSQ